MQLQMHSCNLNSFVKVAQIVLFTYDDTQIDVRCVYNMLHIFQCWAKSVWMQLHAQLHNCTTAFNCTTERPPSRLLELHKLPFLHGRSATNLLWDIIWGAKLKTHTLIKHVYLFSPVMDVVHITWLSDCESDESGGVKADSIVEVVVISEKHWGGKQGWPGGGRWGWQGDIWWLRWASCTSQGDLWSAGW